MKLKKPLLYLIPVLIFLLIFTLGFTGTNFKIDHPQKESDSHIFMKSYSGPFVGSIKSDVYHYPSCSSAKQIKKKNLIIFNSVAEAKAMGYRPCKRCKPPSK